MIQRDNARIDQHPSNSSWQEWFPDDRVIDSWRERQREGEREKKKKREADRPMNLFGVIKSNFLKQPGIGPGWISTRDNINDAHNLYEAQKNKYISDGRVIIRCVIYPWWSWNTGSPRADLQYNN